MPNLPQNPDFPKLENEITEFWQRNNILKKYLNKNANAEKQFSFLDGPITANNPMGVHHGWGRTYKDIWQRFYTMMGHKQRYQNGFDAQGLWVEVEVEKELGFKTKKDIEEYGIDKFVEKCQERVRKFSAIQTEQSKRLGYFMDWDHSYITMSDENNYAIWHFLKKCHEKGLIYKGHDSVPWCPRCGTAISQHEILSEEYKELTHDSVYVLFPVVGQNDTYFLVWTTTPWTLPGNVAIAVGKNVEYVQATYQGKKYIFAKDRLKSIEGFTPGKVEDLGTGSNLTKFTYQGLFDELAVVAQAMNNELHKVVLADFVNLEEGTGLVHIAPGAGTEDYALAKELKLPVIDLIEENAHYRSNLGDLSGLNAVQHPELIFEKLEEKKALFKKLSYMHRYPTCWRCKSELVFRLVDEWYIKMDPIRFDIMAVAKQINWLPKWGLDRELDWLGNMHDWMISKKRYWGLALPIFECHQCGRFEVIGSKEELKNRAVKGWEQFHGHSPHRPWIDQVKMTCECGEVIGRIPDVGNPWLDAGIVPFSTISDPKAAGKVSYFDDPEKKYWRTWFPAEFITESFPGQFKNWFYALLAMSTVLENKAPFKTVLGFGLVRDERGQEMHKSKGNAIKFNEAAEKTGADIMRWIYATANPENNLNFGYSAAEQVQRRFVLILWNVVKFYQTYASFLKISASTHHLFSPQRLIDQWIIARMTQVITQVTDSLKQYDAMTASTTVETFVVDDLSQWYVRRNRKRPDPEFYQVLYAILTHTLQLLAPFLPYVSEYLFQQLKLDKDRESIHLTDWPIADHRYLNDELCTQMDTARTIVSLALAQRAEHGIKVRQPLSQLKVELPIDLPPEIQLIIREEVNVKSLDIKVERQRQEPVVSLDTELSQELIKEGHLRDVGRLLQQLRREAGYQVGEKVPVYWQVGDANGNDLIGKNIIELNKQFSVTLMAVHQAKSDQDKLVEIHGSGFTFRARPKNTG